MASSRADESNDISPTDLRELDPSPIDETPGDAVRDSYFPSTGVSRGSSSSFLGLRDHSLNWWLTRIQQVSTYPLTAFAVLHITNTSLIPLAAQSVPAADTYLLLTRPYYQSYPLEILFLGIPAALHVGSGLSLRLLRWRRALHHAGFESDTLASSVTKALKKRAWPRLSMTSTLGYAAFPVIAAHLLVTRAAPSFVDVPNIDLSYVAHAVARDPWIGIAGLASVIAVAVAHAMLGWSKWLGSTPAIAAAKTSGSFADKRKASRKRWWEIAAITSGTIALWMAGGLGVVARGGKAVGWGGRNYDKILNQIPLLR